MPKDTVAIPKRVLADIVEAGQRLISAEDGLEDFLLASSPDFVKRMRQFRRTHRRGQLGDWERLKARYGL